MRFGLTTSFIDGALAVPAVSGVADAKCARSRAEKFQRATVRRDMCAAAPAKGTSTPFPESISLTPCVHAALVRGVCLVRDARSCPCEALGGKLSLSARIGAWDMQFALERVAAAAGLRQRVQLVPFVTAPEVVDMCDQLPFWCPNRSCTRTPKNMASLTTFCHTAGAYRVPYMAFRSLPIRPPRRHLDTQWSRDGALQRSKFDVQTSSHSKQFFREQGTNSSGKSSHNSPCANSCAHSRLRHSVPSRAVVAIHTCPADQFAMRICLELFHGHVHVKLP